MQLNKIFSFITNCGWPYGTKDRKGLSFLIKAYMEEFTSKDNVKLIVKLNAAYGMTQDLLNKNMTELKIQNKDLPQLVFIADNLPYNKLNEFYNQGDVYVISSLAEGFNLGGLEAMSCGLPVLSTDFGGQTDYINDNNGWLLKDGTMKEVDFDLLYEGISWKIPNLLEFRKMLRYIYEHQDEVKSKKDSALITAQQFTWQNSARRLIDYLKSSDTNDRNENNINNNIIPPKTSI